MIDYTGIIHFHSEYSPDGRVSIPEIIRAARENGIEILMLTDHDSLEARHAGHEGWNGGVLLISGEEISPAQFNHYLAFGHREALGSLADEQTRPQEIIDRVKGAGGFGIIAHPDHEGTELFHVKQYAWKDWTVNGFAAMGVWDFMTDWQDSLTGYARGLASYFCPALFLKGPRRVTLDRWDALNRIGRVTGVAELDNHDTPRQALGLSWSVFPFRKAFRYIRNHFLFDKPLTGRKEEDIPAVYAAILNGRLYASLDWLAPARGFTFVISSGGGDLHMGDTALFNALAQAKSTALVSTPFPGKIKLVRDGKTISQTEGKTLEYRVENAGVYRAEVYSRRFGKDRPWIFSNPIILL